jgi:hypothetical protein
MGRRNYRDAIDLMDRPMKMGLMSANAQSIMSPRLRYQFSIPHAHIVTY